MFKRQSKASRIVTAPVAIWLEGEGAQAGLKTPAPDTPEPAESADQVAGNIVGGTDGHAFSANSVPSFPKPSKPVNDVPVLGYFKANPKQDSQFDGIGFSTTVHVAGKNQPASGTEAVEFFFPLSALRCYESYDCTGQQLIDAGTVLINGKRVSLDLQIAEGLDLRYGGPFTGNSGGDEETHRREPPTEEEARPTDGGIRETLARVGRLIPEKIAGRHTG
jgi:hypothetical protein